MHDNNSQVSSPGNPLDTGTGLIIIMFVVELVEPMHPVCAIIIDSSFENSAT